MSGGDKGKLAGGAAVGAGGILLAALKGGGSAEVHMVEATTRAAAKAGTVGVAHGAGEIGAITRAGAGAGAGVASRGLGSALRTGEHGAERLVLAGAAGEVELRALTPVIAAATDEGAIAAKPLVAATTKTTAKTATTATKASRSAKVKDILSHADHVDPKELLDRLSDVWDLAQALDDGEDDEVDAKFRSLGVDFRGDVVPSVKGAPLPAIPGATRTLLSDGHQLVPAARLPEALPLADVEPRDAEELAYGTRPDLAVYVEHPLPPTLTGAPAHLVPLLARASKDVTWKSFTPSGSLPQVLESGSRRYVRVDVPVSGAPPSRVILLANAAR